MGERMFPIQAERGSEPHPIQIPWSVAELAYSVYSQHHRGQTLEDLARRGGFGPGEMDHWLPGWREMCNDAALGRQVREAAAAMGVEAENVAPMLPNIVKLLENDVRTENRARARAILSRLSAPAEGGITAAEYAEITGSPAPAEGEGVERV